VAEYAAAGRSIEVPAQVCPDCGRALTGWSGYWRWLRDRVAHHVWVRRGRCPACRSTHALLPDLIHERRLDTVDVIGAALARSIGGQGMRRLAVAMDVPLSTARGWRTRHWARTPRWADRWSAAGRRASAAHALRPRGSAHPSDRMEHLTTGSAPIRPLTPGVDAR